MKMARELSYMVHYVEIEVRGVDSFAVLLH